MKIVCLGGGSVYFKRAVPDLLVHPNLAGSEIVLYDIALEKVNAMSAVHEALAEEAATGGHGGARLSVQLPREPAPTRAAGGRGRVDLHHRC